MNIAVAFLGIYIGIKNNGILQSWEKSLKKKGRACAGERERERESQERREC
jgi:hypothetical protein